MEENSCLVYSRMFYVHVRSIKISIKRVCINYRLVFRCTVGVFTTLFFTSKDLTLFILHYVYI